MSDYISKKCTSLTFVNKRIGDIVDKVPCEHGDIAQVIRGAFISYPMQDGRSKLTEANRFVPSGLRLYVFPGFMPRRLASAQAFEFQFNTVLHEISHRVIATMDHWYGEQDSLDAATRNDQDVVDCAENWGFFYADLLSLAP